ncbi:MAG: hypothetical protein ACKV2Q_00925 [Planctomycetaceae bacterium]
MRTAQPLSEDDEQIDLGDASDPETYWGLRVRGDSMVEIRGRSWDWHGVTDDGNAADHR